MIFFSGFSLCGEEELFSEYITFSEYTVCGFSFGAILAFEYVLNAKHRVDTLQFFSPSYFQNQNEKFKRVQTIGYQKDSDAYEREFLKNIAYPSTCDMRTYFKKDQIESLSKLLYYVWDEKKLSELKSRGVQIEVFLGEEDKIIDTKSAYSFFKKYATVYFLKKRGHILHG